MKEYIIELSERMCVVVGYLQDEGLPQSQRESILGWLWELVDQANMIECMC